MCTSVGQLSLYVPNRASGLAQYVAIVCWPRTVAAYGRLGDLRWHDVRF